jgi:hypothetical protein
VREHLREILVSAAFKGSVRSQRLLSYIVENSLDGHFDALKERNLGIELFGRDPSYDTSEDAVVRVAVGGVRKRLLLFYAESVRDTGSRIVLPLGSYIPEFHLAAPRPAPPEADISRPAIPGSRPRRVLQALLLILIGAVFGVAASRLLAVRSHPDFSIYWDLLGPLAVDRSRETKIILSNPPSLLLFFETEHPISPTNTPPAVVAISPDLERQLFVALSARTNSSVPFHGLRWGGLDYTGMGEAASAVYATRVLDALDRPARLSQSRFLNWDVASKQHLIILGAPHMSAWTAQSFREANFTISKSAILNARPLPGEQPAYRMRSQAGHVLEDYGLIWMNAPPSGTRLLVLAGLSSTGTAGVGEFFADPVKMKAVYDLLKRSSAGRGFPSGWQVLLHIEARDSFPLRTSYVAHRIIHSGQ